MRIAGRAAISKSSSIRLSKRPEARPLHLKTKTKRAGAQDVNRKPKYSREEG
jgi:hypothetical protein